MLFLFFFFCRYAFVDAIPVGQYPIPKVPLQSPPTPLHCFPYVYSLLWPLKVPVCLVCTCCVRHKSKGKLKKKKREKSYSRLSRSIFFFFFFSCFSCCCLKNIYNMYPGCDRLDMAVFWCVSVCVSFVFVKYIKEEKLLFNWAQEEEEGNK
jgi:hypothetical protein